MHPLLSGPSFLSTLTANATANLVRNLWTHSVIMCGHFPEGVETFERRSITGETRGEWYLRQMLGSANINGSKAMHFMTGNLSYQVEHHLFPDLPSNRYAEIAPQVQALFAKYGLTYTTGSLPRQVGSAWKKVFRLVAAQRLRPHRAGQGPPARPPHGPPGPVRRRLTGGAARPARGAGRGVAPDPSCNAGLWTLDLRYAACEPSTARAEPASRGDRPGAVRRSPAGRALWTAPPRHTSGGASITPRYSGILGGSAKLE